MRECLVALHIGPLLHLDSHNFLLAGLFFRDGNVVQPLTPFIRGNLLCFFHVEDLQLATAHTITVIFAAPTGPGRIFVVINSCAGSAAQ